MTAAATTSPARATFATLYEEEWLDHEAWINRVPSAEFRTELERRGIVVTQEKGVKVCFVGVAALGNDSCRVLPKVRPEGLQPGPEEDRLLRLVLQSIRRYAREPKDAIRLAPLGLGEGPHSASRLALADWLITDHNRHGLFTTQRRVNELDGRGSVHWPRTIVQVAPVASVGRPVYLHLVTRRRETDDENAVRALHALAVRQAHEQYGPLLGYSSRDDPELARIAAEGRHRQGRAATFLRTALRHTFEDRQVAVIRALREWFVSRPHGERSRLALMGVSTFSSVWEAALRALFSNQSREWEKAMPWPKWILANREFESTKTSLRPDIVRVLHGPAQGKVHLLIIDAKYYLLRYNGLISGEPAIADVAKQYNYGALLMAEATRRFGDPTLVNAFVLPRGKDGLSCEGRVELAGLIGGPIIVLFCGIREALQRYVMVNKFTDCELGSWVCG